MVILRDYHEHVRLQPDTLLTRFLGMHNVYTPGEGKRYCVVMANLLHSAAFECEEIYDLKGSTLRRGGDAPEPRQRGVVYKDLDFRRSLLLGPSKATLLLNQLRVDCAFLERQNIMDYSLLIGYHQLTPEELSVEGPEGLRSPRSRPPGVAYRSVFTREWGALRASSADDAPLGQCYVLGLVDMLQVWYPELFRCSKAEWLARQTYDLKKWLAGSWKSLQHHRNEISTVPARHYAARFLAFIHSKINPTPPPLLLSPRGSDEGTIERSASSSPPPVSSSKGSGV